MIENLLTQLGTMAVVIAVAGCLFRSWLCPGAVVAILRNPEDWLDSAEAMQAFFRGARQRDCLRLSACSDREFVH